MQSKQRRKPTFREAQRRAQSEGPGIRNPLFRAAPDQTNIPISYILSRYPNFKDNFPFFAQNTFCLQSKQRRKPTFREAQRRAQSEGPGIRNPLFRAAPDETDIRPALSTFSRSTSARRGRGSSAQNKAHSTSNDTQVGVLNSKIVIFSTLLFYHKCGKHRSEVAFEFSY